MSIIKEQELLQKQIAFVAQTPHSVLRKSAGGKPQHSAVLVLSPRTERNMQAVVKRREEIAEMNVGVTEEYIALEVYEAFFINNIERYSADEFKVIIKAVLEPENNDEDWRGWFSAIKTTINQKVDMYAVVGHINKLRFKSARYLDEKTPHDAAQKITAFEERVFERLKALVKHGAAKWSSPQFIITTDNICVIAATEQKYITFGIKGTYLNLQSLLLAYEQWYDSTVFIDKK